MRWFRQAFLTVVLFFLLNFFSTCYCQKKFKTSEDRIKLAGFKAEEHKVTTKDGYILSLFRIVKKENNTAQQVRHHPVLIQHGLLMSSDCFVVDAKSGLGFVLAKDNWDVWLGNIRGNSYSRQHKHLSPNGTEFWNYSFHEMGQQDIPAMIDYILDKTGKGRLNYIGHSMGTTMFFVMASTLPSYNKKINTMVSLAPVGRLTKWNFALKNTSFMYQFLQDEMVKHLIRKKVEVLPRTGMQGLSKHQLLLDDLDVLIRSIFELIIKVVDKWVGGEKIFPDSTSLRNFMHFLQISGSGEFRRFDYGSSEKNMQVWGVPSPLPYNMAKIIAPVAVYYSPGDEMMTEEDCEYMAKMLPNVLLKWRAPSIKFSHADFCFTTASENIFLRQQLHDSIINLLRNRDSFDKGTTKKECSNKKDCLTKS